MGLLLESPPKRIWPVATMVRASGGDWGFRDRGIPSTLEPASSTTSFYVIRQAERGTAAAFLEGCWLPAKASGASRSHHSLSSEGAALAVVDDDELWAAVKSPADSAHGNMEDNLRDKPRLDDARALLLSGLYPLRQMRRRILDDLVHCLGCSTARNKGTVANRVNIRQDELERRVLDATTATSWTQHCSPNFATEFTRELVGSGWRWC